VREAHRVASWDLFSTAGQIAPLGQGGLLNKQIAFKFPPYG
jgi:hypothetical protein